jgi:hypothetical protein
MKRRQKVCLDLIKEGDVCVEVGVWKGEFSEKILEKNPKMLHLIDPWVSQKVIQRCYSISQNKMEDIFNEVDRVFGNLPNVQIHRFRSNLVAFDEGELDWVYIDADHSYKAVLADLEHYYPFIKKGGYLCGDDYGLWADRPTSGFGSDGGGGPKPAVDEFVEKSDLKVDIYGDQFIIKV